MHHIAGQLPSFRQASISALLPQGVRLAYRTVQAIDLETFNLSCVHAMKVEVAVFVPTF
jgi:hypothetical protein